MQNLQNIFRFDKSLQIFHPLWGSDMVLRSDFKCSFVTSTPFSAFFTVDVETTHTWSFSKMEDLQLSTLYLSVFLFSKTRKSMNIYESISASEKEHLFSRIFSSGCFFIINITHTKTLILSFLSDKIGWSKNNKQIYLQYIILHIHEKPENAHLVWMN